MKRAKNYSSAGHIVRLNSNETCGKNSSNITRIWYPPGGINASTYEKWKYVPSSQIGDINEFMNYFLTQKMSFSVRESASTEIFLYYMKKLSILL